MVREINSQRSFFGLMALMFAIGSAATVVLCRSMGDMGDMPMQGGWTMSMVWMQMPGQTWCGAAGSFLGMWLVMMAPMMLPSLTPMLGHYRIAAGGTGAHRLGWLTLLVAIGYFSVWTAIGGIVFPLGFWLSAVEMQHPDLSRTVPLAVAVTGAIVGALQLTPWKARCLECCRETPDNDKILPAKVSSAYRHGLRLGLHCLSCCIGLMSILVVAGVMDLRLMALVTAAITAERLATNGAQVARGTGWVTVGVGLWLIAHALPH